MKIKKSNPKSDLLSQYEHIMKYFDFDKVNEYMRWDYSHREYDDSGQCIKKSPWFIYSEKGGFVIPTVEELKDLARQLLTDLINRPNKESYMYVATGPFKATYRYGILELECVIESWSDD